MTIVSFDIQMSLNSSALLSLQGGLDTWTCDKKCLNCILTVARMFFIMPTADSTRNLESLENLNIFIEHFRSSWTHQQTFNSAGIVIHFNISSRQIPFQHSSECRVQCQPNEFVATNRQKINFRSWISSSIDDRMSQSWKKIQINKKRYRKTNYKLTVAQIDE